MSVPHHDQEHHHGPGHGSTHHSDTEMAEAAAYFATLSVAHIPMHEGALAGVSPAIVTSSTFLLDNVEHGARLCEAADKPYAGSDGYLYTRWANPTVEVAAKAIARIEGAKGCRVFPSGMSAITSTLLTALAHGDHVVMPQGTYGGTVQFMSEFAERFGVSVEYVDATNPENYAKAIKENTRIVYAETPCNPTMRVTDLYSLGKIKAGHPRALLVVDGTFASPYNQQVLRIPGVDISIQSATKYLGGHSDITAGSVSSNNDLFLDKLGTTQKLLGGVISPFEAFLLSRGIKTLDVRMERINKSAQVLAEFLSSHHKVAQVNYPGLPTHPDHEIAAKQMQNGFGGMMSFELKGGFEAGRKLVESVKLINLAVSLGGVESLIEHPASMTHTKVPKAQREAAGITDSLIRFSPGIEDVRDIIADLDEALARI